MARSYRNGRRRPVSVAVALVAGAGLIAGACGSKSDDVTAPTTQAPATTAAPATTLAPATTAPPPVVQPVYGGRLVVAVEAETANPWVPESMQCAVSCQMIARTFYDPLVVTDAELEPVGFLLESFTANDDFTVWTLNVRPGINFHDGTPLDAEAVAYNLRNAGKGILLSGALRDLAKGPDGELLITATGPMTVEVRTGLDGDPNQPRPWPTFPYSMGTQWGLIASPTWLQAVKDGTAAPTDAVGTGPFMFSSYAPGDKMIVKRNPNYWLSTPEGDQLPYLDELEFRVIIDGQTRGQALKAGDVDLIHTSDNNVIKPFSTDSAFNYSEQNRYGETNYIMFHLAKAGPLQDQSVRCALWQAIDFDDAVEVLASGFADVANGPFSPGQEGHLANNGSLPYDPDAAAQAIAAYEAQNGPVVINYSSTPTASNLAQAQYLQEVWGAIGVDVNIDQVEQSTLITNALLGSDNFESFGWRNHAGLLVDNQTFWWSSKSILPGFSLNFGRLADPVIDELLAKARGEGDPQIRRGYAEDINRRFAEQCWIIPLTYTKWAIFSKPKVQNIGRSPQASGSGFLRDGQGFPGQVWMHAVFIDG
jgi:peptide/nickel transport system substrate-binding protein